MGRPTDLDLLVMGLQNWIVTPDTKVGDKPAGYAPAVRNW